MKIAVDFMLQLANKHSDVVRNGDVNEGSFYTRSPAKVIKELGNTVQMTSRSVRMKAMQFRKDKKPLVSYNPKTATFKRIAARAAKREIQYMVGVEWTLEYRAARLAYFLSFPMYKRLAFDLRFTFDKPVILTSTKMEYKEHVWYAPALWLKAGVHYGPEMPPLECGPDCEICS